MPFDLDLLVRSARLLAEPVPREKRRLLAVRWRELDLALRTPVPGFGRQAAGCGATLGIFPKCDFDCIGCYLGAEANASRGWRAIARSRSSRSCAAGSARRATCS